MASVMGGLLGNEAIKLVSLRDAPLDNVVFFDGMNGQGAAVVRAGSASESASGGSSAAAAQPGSSAPAGGDEDVIELIDD